MEKVTLEIAPCAKPRMTRRDKWNPSKPAQKYFRFREALSVLALQQRYKVRIPLSIDFFVPIPASWPKDKQARMDGELCVTRPDLSNYIKAFEDALNVDDAYIAEYGPMRKIWSFDPRIVIYQPEESECRRVIHPDEVSRIKSEI